MKILYICENYLKFQMNWVTSPGLEN
jgi:hypothetical protein